MVGPCNVPEILVSGISVIHGDTEKYRLINTRGFSNKHLVKVGEEWVGGATWVRSLG